MSVLCIHCYRKLIFRRKYFFSAEIQGEPHHIALHIDVTKHFSAEIQGEPHHIALHIDVLKRVAHLKFYIGRPIIKYF